MCAAVIGPWCVCRVQGSGYRGDGGESVDLLLLVVLVIVVVALVAAAVVVLNQRRKRGRLLIAKNAPKDGRT
jgi:hypothetical protein